MADSSDDSDFGGCDFVSKAHKTTKTVYMDTVSKVSRFDSKSVSKSSNDDDDEEDEDESPMKFGKKTTKTKAKKMDIDKAIERLAAKKKRRNSDDYFSEEEISINVDAESEGECGDDTTSSRDDSITPPNSQELDSVPRSASGRPQRRGAARGGRGRGRGRGRGATKLNKAIKDLDKLKKKGKAKKKLSNLSSSYLEFVDDGEANGKDFNLMLKYKHLNHKITVNGDFNLGEFVFSVAAEHWDLDPEKMNLFAGTKKLGRNETVRAAGLGLTSLVEVILKKESGEGEEEGKENLNFEDEKIELKFRTKDKKSEISLKVSADDNFGQIMEKYSNEVEQKIKMGKLKFYFDGDLVKKDETPEGLELEGGEVIDVVH